MAENRLVKTQFVLRPWVVFSLLWLMLTIVSLGSCTGKHIQTPPPSKDVPRLMYRVFPGFVAVVAGPDETLSSLAEEHLGDPSMDWLISEFNGVNSLQPGQELVIPLKPYQRGGLTLNGYQTVPVLCYHKFSKTDKSQMTVTEASFEEQMKFLKDRGYRVITLEDLFGFLDFRDQIPQKAVVITIDDGWRSTYDIAYPILKKYRYPATLFVYTDLIVGSKKTLDWNLIREMSENGIDVQCHTKTHRDLSVRGDQESFREYFEAIKKEVTESAKVINKELDKDVRYLAYPFGATNSLVVALLGRLGYLGAFTVERKDNPFFADHYRISRRQIYGEFDQDDFLRSLETFRSFEQNQ